MITPLRRPLRMPLKRNLISQGVIDSALVNLDERGIVGSTPVTAWLNSGTGGSAFDLDVVLGTGANLTRISVAGHDSVNSSGSAGLESTAGQTINFPMTIFLVVKPNVITGTQLFSAAKSLAGSSPQIFASSSSNASFNAGISVNVGTIDTNLRLHSVRYNGDASTNYQVTGIGSITSDAGAENLQFGTLFADSSDAFTLNGAISQYLIFDRALTDSETLEVKARLTQKFRL